MYNRTNHKKLIYILSFMIPVTIMTIASIVLGLVPFGKNTILSSDMNNQFVSFYAYFKSIFTSNNNLFYTFSKNLGGDMLGFSGYYLQNPFLFLLFLFPTKHLPVGIWLIMLLQIGCMGLTMQCYLSGIRECKKENLFFSTAYALLGYTLAYFTLSIYFCNIILLPLAALGIIKIIRNPKEKSLYIFSLMLSVLCNYYLGYMLCIFSVLFFAYQLFLSYENNPQKKEIIKIVKSYIISSIIGVLLSAFDLIPIILSLKGQKGTPSVNTFEFYRNFRMMDVFSRLYTNQYTGNLSNHCMPYIYIGVVLAVFMLLFFFIKNISIKERIATMIFIAILLVSSYIHTFDVIWHGMNDPVGFAFRYSFYLSFLLIHVAYRGMEEYDGKIVPLILTFLLVIFYNAYLYFLSEFSVNQSVLIFDSVIVLVILVLIFIRFHYYVPFSICFVILATVHFFDLFVNTTNSLYQYQKDARIQEDYENDIERMEPLFNKIKEEDTSFYRIEKNFKMNLNDAMMFSYNGLTHNSSCEKDYVKEFEEHLGFRNWGIWAAYNEGSTTFADCFLGVKYFISRFDTTNKPYEDYFHTDDSYVFKNQYAFPLMFGVKEVIKEIHPSEIPEWEIDLFELQNQMISCVSDVSDIYKPADVKNQTVVNLTEEKNENGTHYEKKNFDEEAYISYEVIINENKNLYVFFSAPNMQGAELFVNDFSYDDYFSNTRWNIVNVGNYQAGDKVEIKLKVTGDTLDLYQAFIYEEDTTAFQKMFEQASADFGNLQKISSSHLTGEINLDSDKTVLFTIPYEKDWRIKVDGNYVQKTEVLDALMAVSMSAGSHTIEMYYLPTAFIIGSIISLLTLLGYIILKRFDKERSL